MTFKNDIDLNCTVVVNSCDRYAEAWVPFFDLMQIYWPDCNYNIILNTETIDFIYDNNQIHVRSLNCIGGKDEPWSLRFKNVLKRIKTDFVIVLLEDFFLQALVNQSEIDKCLSWMKKDEDIAVFYYKKITGFDTLSDNLDGYIEMAENKKYKYNCQAALWNRKSLISVLGDNQSPWEFETEWTSEKEQNKKKFYCVKWESKYHLPKNDVFPYLFVVKNGFGIWRSRWLWNNKKLFKKHEINVKYTLGTFSEFEFRIMELKSKSKIILPLLRKAGLARIFKQKR